MPRGYEAQAALFQGARQLSSYARMRLLQAYLGVPLGLQCILGKLSVGSV